jgi:flagellin-like hook-associated protein FlgL
MVAALSASMNAALNNLINVNTSMDQTQIRINTGKSVNDPSDNIAIYFKARSLTDKSDLYTNVNANITQGVANLNFVDKALSNMIDNVKGARQMLADAKAKPAAGTTAVNFTGSQVYANTTLSVGGQTRTIRGQIVDPAGNPNINNGAYFANGDVFRVDIRDASNNSVSTRFFRAVGPDAAAPDQTRSGDTQGNAVEFNDLASLSNALNLGFGRATASFDVVNSAGGVQLKMAMASASQTITFGQTNDASQGALGAGGAFDFTSLLQNASTNSAALTLGNTLDANNAPNASSVTYAPKSGVTTDQNAIDLRKQAADFFRQTMYGLDATVKDAYMPGFANIMKGDTMTIALNDTGTVSQSVKVGTGINLAAITANTFGVGLQNNGGVLSTLYTDTGVAANDNFLSDNQLTNAITKLDAMSIALGQQRQLLAAAKTAMSSRLDLNKSMASSMVDAANAMTAADIPSETASLSALQNRQSFAISALSITRQSEQQLLALLR